MTVNIEIVGNQSACLRSGNSSRCRPKITRPTPYNCINKLSRRWLGKSFLRTRLPCWKRGKLTFSRFAHPLTNRIIRRDCGITMLVISNSSDRLEKRSKVNYRVRVYTFSCLSCGRKSSTDASYFYVVPCFLQSLVISCVYDISMETTNDNQSTNHE